MQFKDLILAAPANRTNHFTGQHFLILCPWVLCQLDVL